MERKIKTGQRVQLAKHDSRVLRGAVGIICDNDSDARFPLVKWMDRSMIAPEVRLRGNSPQARTISVDKIRLELLEDKRRYPINSHVVLVDDIDKYLAGTHATVKCYIGEGTRDSDCLRVEFYKITIGDGTELTVDETQIGTAEDFKFAANPQYDILKDKPICVLDTVKVTGGDSEFEPGDICSVYEVYDNGNMVSISNTDAYDDDNLFVNDVKLVEAKYPLTVGDRVIVTRDAQHHPQGQIGIIKAVDLWDSLPYRVYFEGSEEFDDWWVSAHCIDLADKQPLINKVESETIKHEEEGFSKEVTFFY